MIEPELFSSYARPDLAAVEAEQRALARAVAEAAGPDALIDALGRWNRARLHVDTLRQIAMVRYHQDTRGQATKDEEDFWNEAAPLLRELEVLHARTLLASRQRAAIDKHFGAQLLRLKEQAAATFAPEIRDAIAEEAKLGTEYTELTARPEIEFRGETYSLSGIARFFSDGDRATRLAAQQARDGFLARYGGELDRIYDRLTELRDGMGRALGHDGYTPLGYQLMSRTGYGPAEVAVFRDEIRRQVVPLAGAILAAQARRLGLDKVLFHDEPVGDPQGNPKPGGGVEFCTAEAQKMYRELGPEFGEFFDAMVGRGLLDLETRPGKAGGGFCTHFGDYGLPFVFGNFTGTDDDLRLLTHECGHAFQAWRSRRHALLEYRFPTYEAAEIHSMSMEYLAGPWYERFFGRAGEAARFRRIHLEQALLALPYMALVDHFQHVVYARPRMSPDDRREAWRELERQYLPHRDYGGLFPQLQKGTYWQRQLHVYLMPFYYIDYALAQTCALQLWRRAEEDRPAAIRDYLALSDAGGSGSFGELVAAGRLRSPFEPGCLRDVVAHARSVLGL